MIKLLTVSILLSFSISEAAFALDVEKLFMPGKLISGHQKYESDCIQCHVRMRETTQKKLCLDCHELVAADIQDKKGFHGKNSKANSLDCRECHTDHKGADANIVWLDRDSFDHKQTDYALLGKHQITECTACHIEEKKYREAPGTCIKCHKEDDAHDNKLGEKCGDCHSPKAWGSDQFDHEKTDFKLKQAHEKVACDLCHIENKYKDTPKTCVSCHAIKDVHKNRFGSQCQDCHSEKKWSESIFDHDRDTKYRLKHKHRSVSCYSCHSKAIKKSVQKKTPRNCYDCHRLDDVHKGKNDKKCEQCHSEKSWQDSSFDHDTKTDFALKGKHKEASCQACHHADTPGKKTSTECYSCHKHEDAHKEQQGKQCDNCHNEVTWWLENVRYDHELSDFPLIGQHAVAGCESCHLSSAFKDTKSSCNDCHKNDDLHKRALGKDCKQCHNPNDWLIWEFDHDETDFKIEGAHIEVHCHSCHKKPLEKNSQRKSRCRDCHSQDDIHNGNFGPVCDSCHTQKEFKSINLRSIKNVGN